MPLNADLTVDAKLRRAIHKGDVQRVHELLGQGAKANAISTGPKASVLDATLPLFCAVEAEGLETEARAEIARLLLLAGADPNSEEDGVTALMAAADHGLAPVVALLLSHGADPRKKLLDSDWTAAFWAAASSEPGAAKCLKALLSPEDLPDAARGVESLLHLAAHAGNAASLRFLAPRMDLASTDRDGRNALAMAALAKIDGAQKAKAACDFLASLATPQIVNAVDAQGDTPFLLLIQAQCFDAAAKALPLADLSLNRPNGQTPLLFACCVALSSRPASQPPAWALAEKMAQIASEPDLWSAAELIASAQPHFHRQFLARAEALALKREIDSSRPAGGNASPATREAAARRL